MYLEIITPEKIIFEGEINRVRVPGAMGSFEVLKKHAPIISILEAGSIKIVGVDGYDQYIQIKGGVIEVKNNKVIILAENP